MRGFGNSQDMELPSEQTELGLLLCTSLLSLTENLTAVELFDVSDSGPQAPKRPVIASCTSAVANTV